LGHNYFELEKCHCLLTNKERRGEERRGEERRGEKNRN
jgi:hypothetical protein